MKLKGNIFSASVDRKKGEMFSDNMSDTSKYSKYSKYSKTSNHRRIVTVEPELVEETKKEARKEEVPVKVDIKPVVEMPLQMKAT